MTDRRYEQTWFRAICRHNAPPEIKGEAYEARRLARIKLWRDITQRKAESTPPYRQSCQ
jgi:hypothetical protein